MVVALLREQQLKPKERCWRSFLWILLFLMTAVATAAPRPALTAEVVVADPTTEITGIVSPKFDSDWNEWVDHGTGTEERNLGDSTESSTVGSKGSKGSKGDIGSKGSKGSKGTNGTKGGKGTNGTKGGKGTNGTKGGKGTNGTKGGKGTNGTKGSKGTTPEPVSPPTLPPLSSATPTISPEPTRECECQNSTDVYYRTFKCGQDLYLCVELPVRGLADLNVTCVSGQGVQNYYKLNETECDLFQDREVNDEEDKCPNSSALSHRVYYVNEVEGKKDEGERCDCCTADVEVDSLVFSPSGNLSLRD